MEGGFKIPPLIGFALVGGAAFLFFRSRRAAQGAAPTGIAALNAEIGKAIGGIVGTVQNVVGSLVEPPVQILRTASHEVTALATYGIKAPVTVVKGVVSIGSTAVHKVEGAVGSVVSTIGGWF